MTPPPPLTVIDAGNAEPWHEDFVRVLHGNVQEVQDERSLRLASTGHEGQIHEALDILSRVWPEAAVEVRLLIRSIVLLDETELTASMDHMFGLLFAGTNWLQSRASIFQVLLHETGHHSLFVRQGFTTYVKNPQDMVPHPLRLDPRPVSGTLHAAHVLSRMAQGLHRWADGGAPVDSDVVTRRNDAVAKLSATVNTLREHAEWTDTGELYFERLLSETDKLAGVLSR